MSELLIVCDHMTCNHGDKLLVLAPQCRAGQLGSGSPAADLAALPGSRKAATSSPASRCVTLSHNT